MIGGIRSTFLCVLAVGSLCLAWPVAASARRGLQTGFADGLLASSDPAVRGLWQDRARTANADLVRINAVWRSVTNGEPATPRSSADSAYDFAALDAAVKATAARGMKPLLTVLSAPDFAEGPHRPGFKKAAPGTWKPRPGALKDFAFALAKRYSGSYPDPAGEGALPRVRHLQAWNEPNLDVYLAPQWKHKRPVGAKHYGRMLNAFERGASAAQHGVKVVTGGTAPYGDRPGGARTRPLKFWRTIFCLRNRHKLKAKHKHCRGKKRVKFQILAHHPITTSGGPGRSAVHPDDVTIPDMRALHRTLRAAEKQNTVRGPRHHPTWVTELWWESNPPDTYQGVKEAKHARWIAKALYKLWHQEVRAVINLQIRDSKFDPDNPYARDTTGIFFYDGSKKKAYDAFAFPLVAKGHGNRRRVWGVAPRRGRVKIEGRKKGSWRRLKRVRAHRQGVFSTRVRLRHCKRLRARARGQRSYVWRP